MKKQKEVKETQRELRALFWGVIAITMFYFLVYIFTDPAVNLESSKHRLDTIRNFYDKHIEEGVVIQDTLATLGPWENSLKYFSIEGFDIEYISGHIVIFPQRSKGFEYPKNYKLDVLDSWETELLCYWNKEKGIEEDLKNHNIGVIKQKYSGEFLILNVESSVLRAKGKRAYKAWEDLIKQTEKFHEEHKINLLGIEFDHNVFPPDSVKFWDEL